MIDFFNKIVSIRVLQFLNKTSQPPVYILPINSPTA